jgi:hypothetical protein
MIIFPSFSGFPDDDDGDREYDLALTRWAPFPPLQREDRENGGVRGMRTKEVDNRVLDRGRARDGDRVGAGVGSKVGKKIEDEDEDEDKAGAWGWGRGSETTSNFESPDDSPESGVDIMDHHRDTLQQSRDQQREQPQQPSRGQDEWTTPYTVALFNKDEDVIGFARGRVGLFVGKSFSSSLVPQFRSRSGSCGLLLLLLLLRDPLEVHGVFLFEFATSQQSRVKRESQ